MRASNRCVCIESPFAGEITRNISYADACLRDAFDRGEAAFLGHLLYPRVLDDDAPDDRELGIAAHCAWLSRADLVAVYCDLGVTRGMQLALDLASDLGVPVERRSIGADWYRVLARVRRTRGF